MMQQIYPSPMHSYQYELNKDFHFAAAHYINSDEAGKCKQVHGHTYFVNVTVAGDELDSCGFLVNFSAVKKLIHERFDHTLLNEDELFSDTDANRFPTTENAARIIAEVVQQYLDTFPNGAKCIQVFLRETPSSYVIYRPKAGS